MNSQRLMVQFVLTFCFPPFLLLYFYYKGSYVQKIDTSLLDAYGDERLLFQLIYRRYEKKSIIATSNIPFSEWATLFSDDKVASAILDRLLHHAYVVPIIGNSYRLKDHVSFE